MHQMEIILSNSGNQEPFKRWPAKLSALVRFLPEASHIFNLLWGFIAYTLLLSPFVLIWLQYRWLERVI